MRVPPPLLLLALLALAPRAAAQSGALPAGSPARHALSVNLLGAWYGIYSAELVRAVGAHYAVGVGGTWVGERFNDWRQEGSGSDDRQFLADLKLRGYGGRAPFGGLSATLQFGVYGDRAKRDPSTTGEARGFNYRAVPTVGISFEHTTTRGRRGDPLLVVGAGMKYLLGDYRSVERADPALTMLNLSAGFVF